MEVCNGNVVVYSGPGSNQHRLLKLTPGSHFHVVEITDSVNSCSKFAKLGNFYYDADTDEVRGTKDNMYVSLASNNLKLRFNHDEVIANKALHGDLHGENPYRKYEIKREMAWDESEYLTF